MTLASTPTQVEGILYKYVRKTLNFICLSIKRFKLTSLVIKRVYNNRILLRLITAFIYKNFSNLDPFPRPIEKVLILLERLPQ